MKGFALLLAAALAAPIDARAHRLDEYLQAARFSIERNRVEFEIDLTPGTSVAPQVFALIGTSEDGRISEAEGAAYVEQLRRSIELSVDGTPVALHFAPGQFPPRSEMTAGTGMIRLHASAEFPAVAAGLHQLFYRNTHYPELSVYLSNALVPTDSAIAITAQHRDVTQNELAIDYRVTPKAALFPKWLLLACCSILGIITMLRRLNPNLQVGARL